MTPIEFIKFLVSIGLSPVEIGTIIVAMLLYRKTEQLDAQLHACLDETPQAKALRQDIEDRINWTGDYPGDEKPKNRTD